MRITDRASNTICIGKIGAQSFISPAFGEFILREYSVAHSQNSVRLKQTLKESINMAAKKALRLQFAIFCLGF